jgi:hypothetical protein
MNKDRLFTKRTDLVLYSPTLQKINKQTNKPTMETRGREEYKKKLSKHVKCEILRLHKLDLDWFDCIVKNNLVWVDMIRKIKMNEYIE